jgi:hypothetical protein
MFDGLVVDDKDNQWTGKNLEATVLQPLKN